MDLKTSIIFTVTFCVLVYQGEAVVSVCFNFPLWTQGLSSCPGETFIIMIHWVFLFFTMDVKICRYVMLAELNES